MACPLLLGLQSVLSGSLPRRGLRLALRFSAPRVSLLFRFPLRFFFFGLLGGGVGLLRFARLRLLFPGVPVSSLAAVGFFALLMSWAHNLKCRFLGHYLLCS